MKRKSRKINENQQKDSHSGDTDNNQPQSEEVKILISLKLSN